MGTKVQCKTFLPGFCSMSDVNNNGTSTPWLLPNHENKSRKNSQCTDSVLSARSVDGYLEHEKKIVRQTILKHETIFRHQLQELHRLYKRQRDLMSEHQRTEIHNHRMKTFQSSPSLSHVSSADMKKTWQVSHFPSLDSIACQLSTTDAAKNHSSFNFIENDSRLSPFSSQVTKSSKECESHQPGSSLFRRKIFDPRFVVDGCMNNDKEHPTNKHQGLPCIQGNPVEGIYQIPRSSDAKTSVASVLEFHSGADPNKPDCSKRTSLADLNKPLPLEEARPLVPDINISSVTCLEDDMYGGGKFCPKSLKERSGGISLNHPPCRNGKEQLTFELNAEQNQPDSRSSGRLETAGNLPKVFQSSQRHELFKHSLFEESKTRQKRKKTIFGVEIDEEIQIQSANCSNVHSATHRSQPLTQSYTELLQGLEAYRDNMYMTSDVKSHSCSNDVLPYQNDLCKRSQLIAKEVRDCSLVGCDSASGMTACKLEHCYPKHDWEKTCSRVNDLESESAVLKNDRETSCRIEAAGETPVSGERRTENSRKTLPWLAVKSQQRVEQIKGRENCYHLNLDSLQNYSQQFFRSEDTAVNSSKILDQRQRTLSSRSTKDSDFQKIEVSDSAKVRTIFGVPIFSASEDSHAAGAFAKAKFPVVDGLTVAEVSRDETVSTSQAEAKDSVQVKGLNGCISGLRHQIDLNLSVDEEEVPAPPLPHAVVKIATTEIDLEAPAVLESEAESGNSKHTSEEFNQSNEESMRLAAESIISFSMSGANGEKNDPLQNEPSDCLKWFAEFVSSHCSGQECTGEICSGTFCEFDEESIPDGYDYFEFMTLKLEDMKEEEYLSQMPTLENHNDEETGAAPLQKRPRRGQARRGRQRKDFQRDVLPGLTSLSRYEVNKDILTFEELFKASGSSWQSRSSHKKTVKGGRGRRRLEGADPAPTIPADCKPPVNQPCSSELGLEEKSLTGWGKRTRRLPRQRYLNSNLALPLKQC